MIGGGSTWTASSALPSATAIGGSPLAVSYIWDAKYIWDSELFQINLFYVDNTTKSLFNVVYNGGCTSGAALGPAQFVQWDGANTALAASVEVGTNPGYLRTYYVGADNNFYETTNMGAGQTWEMTSYDWPKVDSTAAGGLASLSWDNQVRNYYVSAGSVIQVSLNNGTWTAATTF